MPTIEYADGSGRRRQEGQLIQLGNGHSHALSKVLLCTMLMLVGNSKSAELTKSGYGAESTSVSSPSDTLAYPAAHIAEGTPMSSPSTSIRTPVVIISDVADYADDNIAILMLLRSNQIDVRGIITTSGNVCARHGAKVASHLLEAAGATSVRVVRGFPLAWHEKRRKFYEEVERPSWNHSTYVGAFAEPRSNDEKSSEFTPETAAADFVIEQAHAVRGGLSIILLGPATVLAEAITKEPKLPRLLRRVNAIGGAISVAGNVTDHAEFNVWFDPEAMAAILASDVPVTLVPLDATTGVTYDVLPPPRRSEFDFAGNHLAAYLEWKGSKHRPVQMWDEILAAVVIAPTLAETSEEIYLSVSTARDFRYGKLLSSPTAADKTSRPVQVVTKVGTDGVRQLVAGLLLGG